MSSERTSDASLRGRIGAHALHARYDSREITAPARLAARTALDERLAAEYGLTEERMGSDEFRRRLDHARSAYFSGLALKSARARRRRRS